VSTSQNLGIIFNIVKTIIGNNLIKLKYASKQAAASRANIRNYGLLP
jgi:hypothetical protein